MDLDKRTYVDGSTIITAQNLNDIQDAIIDLEQNRSVPTSVREAIYTLLENAAYITTGLDDELAVVEAWADEVYSLTLNTTSLSLNQDTPQMITATVVPADATVSWSSSDDDIATVNAGVVTGVSNGTCVITATAGALSATCNVTVSGFATLSSISAVYTQSGTVYDTDSVDSLKADLVVTATYSDSSTATIPSTDYTLSGTLTVGTSTITVTYSGKTDTFSVTVSPPTREMLFGTFTNGYTAVKVSSGGEYPAYTPFCCRQSATARATHLSPVVNNNYVFTVTDSSKYNLAIYDITSLTELSIPNVPSSVDKIGYSAGSKSISWKSSDSATTPYCWIALKKMDNSAFTDAELANGAEAVFDYEISTPENVGYESYPWARTNVTGYADYVYKNQSTSARARSTAPIVNHNYTFSIVDTSKYNMVVYNVTSLDAIDVTGQGGAILHSYPGTDNNKSWGTSGTSSSPYVALSFKKLDNTNFTATELANMYGTVFTYTQS